MLTVINRSVEYTNSFKHIKILLIINVLRFVIPVLLL